MKYFKRPIINDLLLVLFSLILMVWIIFIATPFDILISNSSEFYLVQGSSVFFSGLYYAAVVFLFLALIFLFLSLVLPNSVNKLILVGLVVITICIWLNSTFLVGVYGEFDGRSNVQIDIFSLISWIQIALFLIVTLIVYHFRNHGKFVTYVLASISLITISTSIFNIIEKSYQEDVVFVSDEQFFTYSSNNQNILVLWMDEYQTDFFEYALNEDIKRDLEGFIWYKDNSSNYPTTAAASSGIFSGILYHNNGPLDKFLDEQAAPLSIANKFADMGGQVTTTKPPTFAENLFPPKSIARFNSGNVSDELEPIILLVNYSLFRAAPDILKRQVYNDEKWLIQLDDLIPPGPGTNSLYANVEPSFKGIALRNMDYMSRQQIIAKENYPSSFKFHHNVLTHSPTTFNAECEYIGIVERTLSNKSSEGICALDRISKIIKNLKQQNVFDNTLIIILSDHGSNYKPANFDSTAPYNSAAALLLIKPVGSTQRFRTSNIQSSLSDLPKTIATAFQIENKYPGLDLLDNNKTQARERIYYHYRWSKEYHDLSKNRLPPITKYSINGPLRDPNSWQEHRIFSPVPCGKAINFDNSEQSNYYDLYGFSSPEIWGRWADGKEALIKFQTELSCNPKTASFKLRAFISKKNLNQQAYVTINDKIVDSISMTQGGNNEQTFHFDLPETSDRTYSINFDFKAPVSPSSITNSSDNRELSFGFISLELNMK